MCSPLPHLHLEQLEGVVEQQANEIAALRVQLAGGGGSDTGTLESRAVEAEASAESALEGAHK